MTSDQRWQGDEPVSDLVTAAVDLTGADWIGPQLMAWWSLPDGHMPVGAIIPKNFPSYARILHPAERAGPQGPIPVRWSEVATSRGLSVEPETLWEEIEPPEGAGVINAGPSEGSLPLEDAGRLARILRRHTSRPDACLFAVWDGYGALDPDKRWPNAPRLRLPNRDYVLLRGPIEAAGQSFEPAPFHQSASLWWPDDRAWCVATEIDYSWTYVGGSEACIEDILTSGFLETLPIRPESRAAGQTPGAR